MLRFKSSFMIKQDIFVFTGTQDNLTCYYSKGRAILRARSSLDGERVKRDPAFKGFRQSGQRLKRASPLAAALYAQIPAGKREYAMYRILTGEAIRLLKQGLEEKAIDCILWETYIEPLQKAAVAGSRRVVVNSAETSRSAFAYRALQGDSTLRRRRLKKRVDLTPAWPIDRLHCSFGNRLQRTKKPDPPGLIYIGRCEQVPKLKWYLRGEIADIIKTSGEKMDWKNWLFNADIY